MGYTHLGHFFQSNMPPEAQKEVLESNKEKKDVPLIPIEDGKPKKEKKQKKTKKVAVGDDLGSLNYL